MAIKKFIPEHEPDPVAINGKAPAFPCPKCNARGAARSMTPITPMTRRLYYVCPNLKCGHTWAALLEFLNTITESRLGPVDRNTPFLRLKQRPPDRPPVT